MTSWPCGGRGRAICRVTAAPVDLTWLKKLRSACGSWRTHLLSPNAQRRTLTDTTMAWARHRRVPLGVANSRQRHCHELYFHHDQSRPPCCRDRRLGRRHPGDGGLLPPRRCQRRNGLRHRHPSQPAAREPAAPGDRTADRAARARSPRTAPGSRPGNVYVMPENATLTISDGRLRLHEVDPVASRAQAGRRVLQPPWPRTRARTPSASCCRAATATAPSASRRSRSMAASPSPRDHDGSGPRNPEMPDSAISSGLVDFALPVEQMGAKLEEIVRAAGDPRRLVASARRPTASACGGRRTEISQLLRSQSGTTSPATRARPSCAASRRRMQVVQTPDDRRPTCAAARGAGRGHGAVPRPPDQRHRVLPRRRRLPGARGPGDPPPPRGPRRRRDRAGLGARLRHRRGGLFARHPAARADRSDRRAAARADLRHRHRRSRPGGRARRPLSGAAAEGREPGAPAALLRQGRRQLGRQGTAARHLRLLAAQHHQRPAVFAHGPGLLSQPADLSRPRAAGAGHPHLPLRAEARRLPVSRDVREHQPAQRPLRPGRQEAAHLPEPRTGLGPRRLPIALDGACAATRSFDDGTRGRRRPRPTSCASGSRRRCWSATRPPMSSIRNGGRHRLLLRPHRPLPRGAARRAEPAALRHGPARAAARPARGAAAGDGDRPPSRAHRACCPTAEGDADMVAICGRAARTARPERPTRCFLVLFAAARAGAAHPPSTGSRRRRREARPGRARAARHARAAAVDGRGVRDRARGAEVVERGTGLGQRGGAIDQRGARGLQGGDAVAQRGAHHDQRRAQQQGRGARQRQHRPEEPLRGDPDRHGLPRRRARHPQLHAGGRRRSSTCAAPTSAGR